MTKAQMMAMSDVEVRLRLENTRLKIKIGVKAMQMKVEKGRSQGLSRLIAGVNRLRAQEKKWRRELDRRAAATENKLRVIGKKTWDDSFVVINEERRGAKS